MKTDGNDNSVVNVLGHSFRRVKSGLDEKQVVPFIEQLISERDTLIMRQEHLSSLTRLYENTVAEADELANQIKKEAEEQARVESKDILDEAENQVKQILEGKKAEAMAIAEKEAEAIKADAQKQSEALLKRKVEQLQSQLRDTTRLLYEEMLAQAESLKQQVATIEADFEQTLSELVQQNRLAVMEKENKTTTGVNLGVITEAATQAHTLDESDTTKTEELTPISQKDSKAADYDEWVELEILNPRGKDEIDGIKTYLDGLTEVRITELITMIDKTLIEVSLNKPIDLIKTLPALPQVKGAEEIINGDQRKIQIRLALKSNIEISKDKLNTEVNRIFSEGHK